ncbi:MAG: hypothetical protein AAFU85_29510 [Planctomycetota bacterium]
MIALRTGILGVCLLFPFAQSGYTQDAPTGHEVSAADADVVGDAAEKATEIADSAKANVDELADRVDQDDRAIRAKNSILSPIYQLAEKMSFSAFHWLAFALMVSGVVSYALQLVLGKLVVLSKVGLSVTEILSDGLGLAISLVGLVLTTQAAAENSAFTESAFAVLSATVLGCGVGFIFYLWGQREELQAVEGRKSAARKEK